MTREYEAVYIFDSTLEDSAINEKLKKFHDLLGDKQPDFNHWGRRQLAYSIGTRANGYYVISKFNAEPTALPEYERALKLDDGVVRYLVTLHEHETGMPNLSDDDLPRRDDDEDEDE